MRGYTMTTEQDPARLRAIAGPARGLQHLIDEATSCIDVRQQVDAVNGALQNAATGLLDGHVGHGVADDAAAADQGEAREMVTEASRAVARLVES